MLRAVLGGTGLALVVGTFLPLLPHPHWAIRDWDYPRPQMLALLAAVGVAYAGVTRLALGLDAVVLGVLALAAAMQLYKLAPYTPLARCSVPGAAMRPREKRLRMLISNVRMENRDHERLLKAVRRHEPDLLLAIDVDQAWCDALACLRDEDGYRHCLLVPQDNHFGMGLYSRTELIDAHVRNLVQDDVPSIHTRVRLGDRTPVSLHCLHPRPPEPTRDQDSVPRDAELVTLAREVARGNGPAVVVGDLNDVAWSATTALFLRLSKMLDPRVGRGLFNTWNAYTPFLRVALDHVFHSDRFALGDLRVLGHVGSDHFPVLVELVYAPDADTEAPQQAAGDDRQALEKLHRAEAQGFGDARPPGTAS